MNTNEESGTDERQNKREELKLLRAYLHKKKRVCKTIDACIDSAHMWRWAFGFSPTHEELDNSSITDDTERRAVIYFIKMMEAAVLINVVHDLKKKKNLF